MKTDAIRETALTPRVLLNLVWMLLATDLALIAIHVVTGLSVVNLDEEANLSTWYSSLKLMLLALLSLAAWVHDDGTRPRWIWLVGAVLFTALSADEAAHLHERLSDWVLGLGALASAREVLTGGDELKASHAWVAALAPIVVAVLAFFVLLALRGFRRNRASIGLLFGGLLCLVSAMALESAVVAAMPRLADWGTHEIGVYRVLTTFEESAELIGLSLLAAAFCVHLTRRPSAG